MWVILLVSLILKFATIERCFFNSSGINTNTYFMDETQKHAEWDTRNCILYDSIYVKCLEKAY